MRRLLFTERSVNKSAGFWSARAAEGAWSGWRGAGGSMGGAAVQLRSRGSMSGAAVQLRAGDSMGGAPVELWSTEFGRGTRFGFANPVFVQMGYRVGSVTYWRPEGAVQRTEPLSSCSAFQRGCCLRRWSWRHLGFPLHRHDLPPAS